MSTNSLPAAIVGARIACTALDRAIESQLARWQVLRADIGRLQDLIVEKEFLLQGIDDGIAGLEKESEAADERLTQLLDELVLQFPELGDG